MSLFTYGDTDAAEYQRLDGRPRNIIDNLVVIVSFAVEDNDNYGNTLANISS